MQLSSKLNTPTTRSEIRSAAIYSLSARFYAINLILLAILALAFLWWSRHESLDIAISQRWFDPLTRRFPWQHNRWLDLINHRLMKDVIIAGAVLLLLRGLQQRDARRVLVALLFGMGPLVVGMLKAHSAHSCPWDLTLFGGNAASFPLLAAVPANSGPGQCFPGGSAQVMRGAHYFAHNLWAGWWVWLSQLLIFAAISFWVNKTRTRKRDGSS